MYPALDDDSSFRFALRSATRACVMISCVSPANRCDEGSLGSMHGSGKHMRRDGYLAEHPCRDQLPRKRKRGSCRDQGSARGQARKLLRVWQGECTSHDHVHMSLGALGFRTSPPPFSPPKRRTPLSSFATLCWSRLWLAICGWERGGGY